MKHVTASEARKNWFRLLDDIVQGEVVVLERHGRRIVLRSEEEETRSKIPDYRRLLQVTEPEQAHRWGWEWVGPEQNLVPALTDPERDRRP